MITQIQYAINLLFLPMLALSASTTLPSFIRTPNNASNQINNRAIAQATYRGYLQDCDDSESGDCEADRNHAKASVKSLCYSVWTGNWPDRNTLSPYQVKMYIDWCREAQSDIGNAKREYPALIDYVSRYRGFNPHNDPFGAVNAALNTQYFLGKCASGAALRSTKAMEIWGTTLYGNWVIPELEPLSPSRYPEILQACDRKSWARQLLADTQPIIEDSWSKQVASIKAASCKIPTKGSVPELADLEALKASRKLLNEFTVQAPLLAKMEPKPIPESEDQLSLLITTAKEKSQTCEQAIQQSANMIQMAEEEKERQRQLQAAREADAARKAAAARAEQQRRAEAVRAAEAAAAAERARKQAEVQRLKDNLNLE